MTMNGQTGAFRKLGRRGFLGACGALPFIAASGLRSSPTSSFPRTQVRALLVSATTLAGMGSLEHAREELKSLYAGCRRLLLINFASMPGDRDGYAARMQRDFSHVSAELRVDSLHAVAIADATKAIRDAEAVYVSGGNTFLLLRELYDRDAVDLLRERVLAGVPYAGASAGSNLAGTVIGTTNDFPLVDVPTRRSLGIIPAAFNPHHPDPSEEKDFASRQWKIRQYAEYHSDETVIGVNNAGMVRVVGDELTLRGEAGVAMVNRSTGARQVRDTERGNISRAIAELTAPSGASAS